MLVFAIAVVDLEIVTARRSATHYLGGVPPHRYLGSGRSWANWLKSVKHLLAITKNLYDKPRLWCRCLKRGNHLCTCKLCYTLHWLLPLLSQFGKADAIHTATFARSCIDTPHTLCLKKGPTCKLSVTLSNLNRFSKFLHCWKAYKIRCKTNTLSLIHIWRCRRSTLCRSRWSPYH